MFRRASCLRGLADDVCVLRILTVECPALVDSGASDNFISQSLVRYLQLKVKDLPAPCSIRAATLGELRFTLTLRVVPTDPRVTLGYPFLRFFDPEIWWRERKMNISKGLANT